MTGIADNKFLQAIAIILAVATALFYVTKFLLWLLRKVGPWFSENYRRQVGAQQHKLRLEQAAILIDPQMLILALVKRVYGIVLLVIIVLILYVVFKDVIRIYLGQTGSSLLFSTIGVATGQKIADFGIFVREARSDRIRQLGESYTTFKDRKF